MSMHTFKLLRKICRENEVSLGASRLALVGDTATQFLATSLRGEELLRGFDINLFEAEYNMHLILIIKNSTVLM